MCKWIDLRYSYGYRSYMEYVPCYKFPCAGETEASLTLEWPCEVLHSEPAAPKPESPKPDTEVKKRRRGTTRLEREISKLHIDMNLPYREKQDSIILNQPSEAASPEPENDVKRKRRRTARLKREVQDLYIDMKH